MSPADPRTRRWLATAWVCLVLLVPPTVFYGRQSVVRCDTVVWEVPEPDGWRAWPIANHELFAGEWGPDMCPNSRPPWLANLVGREFSKFGDVGVHKGEGVFVASQLIHPHPPDLKDASLGMPAMHEEGIMGRPDPFGLYGPRPPERFLVAFRREFGAHLAVAWDPATAALLFGLAFVLVAGALASTFRQLRRLRRTATPAVPTLAAPYRGAPPERASDPGSRFARTEERGARRPPHSDCDDRCGRALRTGDRGDHGDLCDRSGG